MNPNDLLAKFHRKDLSFRDLLRQLISYDDWIIPAQKGIDEPTPSLWKSNEQIWLAVFSSLDDYHAQMSASGTLESEHMIVDGRWLFSSLAPPINAMVIDPHSPNAVQFGEKMFESLNQWSQTVSIERILSGQDNRQQSMTALREFATYYVPLIRTPDGSSHIALAPDAQNRKLAAIFTAEDTLQEFLRIAKDALGDNIIIDITPGYKLFEYLRDLPIEGVVFNCNGPIAPCAITLQMVNMILNDESN